jgi:hypothetical protein
MAARLLSSPSPAQPLHRHPVSKWGRIAARLPLSPSLPRGGGATQTWRGVRSFRQRNHLVNQRGERVVLASKHVIAR